MSDMNAERGETDSAEQDQDAIPEPASSDGPGDEVPFEADAADAVEQGREVGTGEDEYR